MSHIHVDERDGACRLTLGRTPLNVLDVATLEQLRGLIEPLAQRRDVKAAVLRSSLPGTFSAGADVADHTRERAPAP